MSEEEKILIEFEKLCEKYPKNTKIFVIRYNFNEVHEDPWKIDGNYRFFKNSDDAVKFKENHKGTIILPYTITELSYIIKHQIERKVVV